MAQGIAAIGECMLELSGQGDNTWRMGHGGDTFNTLWALRALSAGHHVDYVSAFGDDPFSEAQIEYFREHGIGNRRQPDYPGRASRRLCHYAQGRRTFFHLLAW